MLVLPSRVSLTPCRQVFYNFTEERDPETLSRLHSKARQDAEWVLKKVRVGAAAAAALVATAAAATRMIDGCCMLCKCTLKGSDSRSSSCNSVAV
jgi:hypothetical protein